MTATVSSKLQTYPDGLAHIAVLAANKPHGVRLRYMAGCRCLKCRMANSNYEVMRARARKAGDWNGLVDATDARRHLLALSRRGVGRRALARASGVSLTTIAGLRAGRSSQISARTAKRIMAVTPDMRAPRAVISAKRLWKRLNGLLAEGFTKAELARRLGLKTRAIQFRHDFVTVKSDRAVGLLYRRLMS